MNTERMEQIERFLDRSMSADERERFCRDVRADAELRAALVSALRVDGLARAAGNAEAWTAELARVTSLLIAKEDTQDSFESRVLARCEAAGVEQGRPRRVRRRIFLWAPLAAAAVLMVAVGGYWMMPAASPGVRVAEVSGEANIQHSTFNIQQPRQEKVVVGMELRRGDRVVVPEGGRAVLKYEGEETTLALHSGMATLGAGAGAKRVKLESGLLICGVAPQKRPFLLETPHGVAEVVGTRFSLGANAAQTTLAVEDGRMGLHQQDQRLAVSAGETAMADAAGMRKLSPADAWICELLARAETGPWDVVNLGTGVYSNDVWRMDARGGPAERRIWNMPVKSGVASVVNLVEVRRPVRGVIACRMMIRPDGWRAAEVDGGLAVTNGAWRTSRFSRADQMPSRWRNARRGSLRLEYNLSGIDRYWSGDVLNAAEHLTGVWHRFVVYVDTETPDGIHIVYSAWPDGSVPSSASAWVVEFDKGTVDDTVKIGLMAKGVLMEVQGLKFVSLGADMPLPPKELLERK